MARIKSKKKFFKEATSHQSVNLDLSISGYAVLLNYLLRWSASIYRLVWIDILVWLLLYYTINLVYRFALNKDQKFVFENTAEQVGEWSAKIPVTFLLGFFVSNVVSRWWNIYMNIPRMNGPAAVLVSCIRGDDGARFRTEIGRYLNLAWVLSFWGYCGGLRNRFEIIKELAAEADGEIILEEDGSLYLETEDSSREEFDRLLRQCLLPDSGKVAHSLERLAILNADPIVRKNCGHLVTRSEFAVFLKRSSKANGNYSPEWYIPIYWALELTHQALKAGCIRDTLVLENVQAEIQAWSGKIRSLGHFAKRQLPLVYTQVVMIAVYTIYLTDIISRQMVDPKIPLVRKAKGYYVDYFVPVLAIVHVVFLLGWFKVALVLMDPFGTDEEDFPFSQTFSNNLKAVRVQCPGDQSMYPAKLGGSASDDDTDMINSQFLQLEGNSSTVDKQLAEADTD